MKSITDKSYTGCPSSFLLLPSATSPNFSRHSVLWIKINEGEKSWGFGSKSFQGTDAKIASCKKSRLANFASGSMHSSISRIRIFRAIKKFAPIRKEIWNSRIFCNPFLERIECGLLLSIHREWWRCGIDWNVFNAAMLHEKIWTSTNSFCCRIPETRRPKYAIHFLSTTPLTQIYQSLFRVGRLLKKSRGKSI